MLSRTCFPIVEQLCRTALESGGKAHPLVGRLRNLVQREALTDPSAFASRDAALAFLRESERQADSLGRLLRHKVAPPNPTRTSEDSIARLYRLGGLQEGHLQAADDLRRAHVLLTAPVQARTFRYEPRAEERGHRDTPHDYSARQLDCIHRYRTWTDAMAERRLDHLKAWRDAVCARRRAGPLVTQRPSPLWLVGPIMDVVVEGLTIVQSERFRVLRNGSLSEPLVLGLGLYAERAGWLTRRQPVPAGRRVQVREA